MSAARMKSCAATRRGSALVISLFAMFIVLSIALSSATVVSIRGKVFARAREREIARDAAIDAIAASIAMLQADTNGVDHLGEEWCANAPCVMADEQSKLNLAYATAPQIFALLKSSAACDAVEVESMAQCIANWVASNEKRPQVIEQFARVPGMRADVLAKLADCATACGDGKVNVNTVPAGTLKALLVEDEAGDGIVEQFARNMEASRKRGVVVQDITAADLARVFVGEGLVPSVEQSRAINAMLGRFCAASQFASGVAQAKSRSGGNVVCTIRFTYDRANSRMVSWSEY